MRARLVFAVVSIALGAFVACSNELKLPPAGTAPSTVQPGNAGGAGSEAGAGDSGGAGDGGTLCNALTLNGKLVDALNIQGDPPASNGGTIVDGDYDLTSVNVYV